MRAVILKGYGDESVLDLANVPPPALGEDDVRIAVRTTAVNRADILQRQGHYPPPPGASEILGLEAAGEITEVGSKVSGWSSGARVMALLPGGGYAEEAVADAGTLIAVPDSFSDEEAGAFPEVFLTAYLNLFLLAQLQRGETVLIHGGGSGVGTAATTLARLAGARVVVTAGSDEKCRRCLEHGADEAVNYRTEDFAQRLRNIDVILDHIGATYLTRNLSILGTGGRLVIIGGMGGGRSAEVDLTSLLGKRLQIIGSTLRSRPVAEKRRIIASFVDRFGTELRAGKIVPVIDRVFSLEEVDEAHRRINHPEHFGKIVLRVR